MIITGGYKKCDIGQFSTSIIPSYETIKDIMAPLCRFKKQKNEFDFYKDYNKGSNAPIYVVYKDFHFNPEYRKSLLDMSKSNKERLVYHSKWTKINTMEYISISYEDYIEYENDFK